MHIDIGGVEKLPQFARSRNFTFSKTGSKRNRFCGFAFPLSLLCAAFGVSAAGCGSEAGLSDATIQEADGFVKESAIVVLYGNGESCEYGQWCESGFCVDGVCCESACEGLCMGCNIDLNEVESGRCLPVVEVPALDFPKTRECDVDAVNPCGQTGFCSGVLAPEEPSRSSCALAKANTICQEAHCYSNDLYSEQRCNGFGVCGAHVLQEQCGLYACQTLNCEPECPTNCASDAQCDDLVEAWCYLGSTTNANYQTCLTGKRDGDSCISHSECGSGFCNDGVCCSSACEGTCESCNTVNTGRTNGVCHMVKDGHNWDDCATDVLNQPCGFTGQCNGAGACHIQPRNTVCESKTCQNGTVFSEALCDGLGTCNPGGPEQNCGQYSCRNGQCLQSCDGDEDCASDFVCYRVADSGICTDKKLNGVVCSGGHQCASGHCVDGVCCESSCEGECRGCRQSKTGRPDGQCEDLLDGTDPDRECALATCSSDSQARVPRSVCDGGSCTAPPRVDCGSYTCDSGNCLRSCPSDIAGEVHPNCAAEAPICYWGMCSDNNPPIADVVTQEIAQGTTTAIALPARDPDGDFPLFYEVEQSGNWVLAESPLNYFPRTCQGMEAVRYRVYDREDTENRLYSDVGVVWADVYNVRPTISYINNGSVRHNGVVEKSFSYSDPCTSGADLTLTAWTYGPGTAEISGNNNEGEVRWTPRRSTPDDFCSGPTSAHLRQQALVTVTVSDGNLQGMTQFWATASAATRCEQTCTYSWGDWCHTTEILPANCAYCRDYNREYRCGFLWLDTCTERMSSCNDVASTSGVFSGVADWFQSVGCEITFGLIPCPSPPDCWWY